LQIAYIYRISDDKGHQYIGYTTRDIYDRYAEQKDEATSPKMHEWLLSTKTSIELVTTIYYLELTEVTDIEADYIKQIPHNKTMNTRHASQTPMQEEHCSYHTVSPRPPSSQWPKISDQPKSKRYRMQWREDGKVKSKTFSYKSGDSRQALQAAENFRSDRFA
jgi:predicted GIY-YIG superfamily endonuclease